MNSNIEDKLKEIYYDPATGLSSAQHLYINANKEGKIVTLKQVKEWISKQQTHQVFAPKRNYIMLLLVVLMIIK
jgi:hypothetical protein